LMVIDINLFVLLYERVPLVPRWSLMVIDINLFVLLCFLIHRDVIASLWSSCLLTSQHLYPSV
jgi:hypothetical protein